MHIESATLTFVLLGTPILFSRGHYCVRPICLDFFILERLTPLKRLKWTYETKQKITSENGVYAWITTNKNKYKNNLVKLPTVS